MFDNLSDSLQSAFKNITGRGTLSESNIREAMEEVRLALLSADVSYGIVQDFIEEATTACLGEDVTKSVKPGQQVIKVVNDLLVELMGQEEAPLELDKTPSVIMMVGLHGAGKTTMIRIINRIVEADGGSVRFNGDLMVAADLAKISFALCSFTGSSLV